MTSEKKPFRIIFKECSIEMSVNPGDSQSVSLLPLDLLMEQSQDMTLFSITDKMLVNIDRPRKGIKMTIMMNLNCLCKLLRS